MLQIVTNKIGSASAGGHTGFNLGALFNKGFGGSAGYGATVAVDATAHGAAI